MNPFIVKDQIHLSEDGIYDFSGVTLQKHSDYSGAILSTNGKSNIVIRGGIFDGSEVTEEGRNPAGITVSTGSRNIKIVNPTVRNFYFCGIFLSGCSNVQIMNPTTLNCGRSPNQIGGIEAAYDAHDIQILNHYSEADARGLYLAGRGGSHAVYSVVACGIVKNAHKAAGNSVQMDDARKCSISYISENPYRNNLVMRKINYGIDLNDISLITDFAVHRFTTDINRTEIII